VGVFAQKFCGGAIADRRGGREVAVVFEQGSGFASDHGDGAGDVAEGFGEGVEGGLFAQMEKGEQDPFAVADLLGEHAAAGAGLAGPAAALVSQPLGVGGLAGSETLDETA
jgi:hypothetical protein